MLHPVCVKRQNRYDDNCDENFKGRDIKGYDLALVPVPNELRQQDRINLYYNPM